MTTFADDCRKDKKHVMGGEEEKEEDLLISSGLLVEIMEESMRIFWKFLRKDEKNAILKSLQETQVEHKDLDLLIDIRKDLQKVCFRTLIILYGLAFVLDFDHPSHIAEGEEAQRHTEK